MLMSHIIQAQQFARQFKRDARLQQLVFTQHLMLLIRLDAARLKHGMTLRQIKQRPRGDRYDQAVVNLHGHWASYAGFCTATRKPAITASCSVRKSMVSMDGAAKPDASSNRFT